MVDGFTGLDSFCQEATRLSNSWPESCLNGKLETHKSRLQPATNLLLVWLLSGIVLLWEAGADAPQSVPALGHGNL
jgi:hypothetical protein